MKLSAILLFTASVTVSAKSLSQTVTLDMKNVPVQKVFRELSRQTGFSIIYNDELLNKLAPITIKIKDATVQDAMDKCLQGQPFEYQFTGTTIVVKEKPVVNLPPSEANAPPHDIHGTVLTKEGEPLAGANVNIKRTGKGTITNAKGEFALQNMEPTDEIVVSFVGYARQTIPVKDRKEFVVYMEVATNDLDKVVVQAYGTTTQRLATGNITTVTAAEIEKQPVINPLQALQGRVAGLVITQTSGYASSPFTVEIRGRSTISNSIPSDPLYIIDGVPLTILEVGGGSSYQNGSTGFIQNNLTGPASGQSPFFSINPDDIESITVLKDADATAIYGSRGANGVIIITTKKGMAQKTKVNISMYQGVSEVTRHWSLMNTQQYVQMRKEALKNDNMVMTSGNAYDILIWDTTRYTDWQKYLWGNRGNTTKAQVDVSGGDKQTTFRLGASYNRLTDITTASGASQRGSLQFNLDHKSLDQRWNVDFTGYYSFAALDMIDITNLATLPPNAPAVYNSQGELNWTGWAPASNSFPFAKLLQPYTSTTRFLNSKLYLKYEIFKGLTISANTGYSNAIVFQHQEYPIQSQNPARSPVGIAFFGNNNNSNWIIEPQMEYNKILGKGKLNVLIGSSLQEASYSGMNVEGSGYTNDNLLGSVSNAPVVTSTDNYGQYKYIAVFGRVNYNWANKYIIDISARRDGSSRFGPGKQFGNFGAVGMAWIMSEEKWFKDAFSFLSFGKLRASYGATGNDQIGDYQYLTRWSGSNIPPYQGYPSYVPLQHANADYQWEVNKKLEFTLNIGLLKDRIGLEVSWYQNRCNDQLISYILPNLTGFPSVTANSPASVQNRGIELNISSKIIAKENVEWQLHLNVAANRNKLLAYPDLDLSSYAYIYFIGKPLNTQRLLQYTGVDPQTGKYTFLDKNKDGVITNGRGTNDDLFDRDLNPKFTGGLGNDFSYKRWQLSFFLHFRKQAGKNAFVSRVPGTILNNQPTVFLDRWGKPGDKANYAKYTTQAAASDNYFFNSDAIITDASFIRLSNLSLSYTVQQQTASKSKLQSCRFFVQGENLFVLTRFEGIDPETRVGFMPPAKVFTGGIQITF